MRNIESIGFTPTRKRANRIQGSIEDILTESRVKVIEDKENLLLESDMMMDVSITSTRRRDEVGKTQNNFINKLNEDKIDEMLLGEAFSNIVYKAIPLDESYKEEHKSEIMDKATGVILEMKKLGILQEGNYVWKTYYNDIAEAKPMLKESANDLITVEKILSETEAIVKNELEGIASIVENKILTTIADEKVIAENKIHLMQENRKFNGSTLFNSINVKNYRMASDKFVDGSKQDVLEFALAETVIDYTILESLNTLKLAEFKLESVIKAVKHV